MEHCYLVSTSILREILDPLATFEACYRLVHGKDIVTVIRYGPKKMVQQVAFPVVYRIEDVPEDEGTLILMVGTKQSPEWQNFWTPVAKQLGRTAMYPTA